jgi:predicted MFS family arabinose efflux permease
LADLAGWRASFLVLALLALVVSVLLGRRLGSGLFRLESSESGLSFRASFRPYLTLFSRPAGQRLMVAAFIDGAALFGGAFPLTGSLLIERFGYSPAMAGLVVAGFGLGAFTYTRLAKRLVGPRSAGCTAAPYAVSKPGARSRAAASATSASMKLADSVGP